MSLNIKYRVWDNCDKIMSYNVAFVGNRILFNYLIEEEDIYCNDYVDIDEENRKYFEIMQFTGLKDKNGKEIYVGDILKCNSSIYEVINDYGCFQLRKINGFQIDLIIEYSMNLFEVIGNIYENKELLEGK